MYDVVKRPDTLCVPVRIIDSIGMSQTQPAQSCQAINDLLNKQSNGMYHNLQVHHYPCMYIIYTGWYWIDPNLGCSQDSVYIYCNFTSKETCIDIVPYPLVIDNNN